MALPKTSNVASLNKEPNDRITSPVKQWRRRSNDCGKKSNNYDGENENRRPEGSSASHKH
jgi:hypothetical protein